jgi:hypothetical protein
VQEGSKEDTEGEEEDGESGEVIVQRIDEMYATELHQ